MPEDVGRDQFALIRIEGMHCHKCEKAIQKSMLQHPGVHEVEVDFASGQASVLFDSQRVTVKQLDRIRQRSRLPRDRLHAARDGAQQRR